MLQRMINRSIRRTAVLLMLVSICTTIRCTECLRNRGRKDSTVIKPVRSTHFLAVAAIFKNEQTVIREWCEHYIEEGIDHIFLIDNNSTDGYLKTIEDFIKSGRVTLLLDPTRYNQDEIYTRHLTMYLPTVAWMAILDLDEFMYGRNTTIAAYLSSLDDDIGVVRLAWKQFGSSGHIRQPESLVQGFTSRGAFNNDNVNIKSIFRSSAVTKLQMHMSEVSPNFRSVSPQQIPKPSGVESGEAALQQHVLHLNHYQLQSREWFLNVKATRGSATTAQEDGLRDAHYFDISDQAYTGIPDDELKLKKAVTESASPYQLWQS